MKETMLITGCAGFIGNAACDHYRQRFRVIGIDDLSRPTARKPLGIEFHQANAATIDHLDIPFTDIIIHLAAQVSVVSSVRDPVGDFFNNARTGLVMALWAKRRNAERFIYSSTNKVYGELNGAYAPIKDNQPLDPCTPYGISKATAGMYIRDFLPEVSYDFRQSCIYSENQIGTLDQGWVGFVKTSIAKGQPIVCYGNGQQTRDLLHVEDLLRVYDLAINGKLKPGSYTVGGGIENAFTFEEVVDLLGGEIDHHEEPRIHDQQYFVSANSGLKYQCGFRPQINAGEWMKKFRVPSRNSHAVGVE